MFAPKAITYHRLHGTAGRIAYAQRLRLYERNAIAMIYKNYESDTLRRVLPVAVALSLLRGLKHSGIDLRALDLQSPERGELAMSARLSAHLLALEDFGRLLPALNRARAEIQRRRRVADADIVKLFGGEPFRLHEEGEYADIAHALI